MKILGISLGHDTNFTLLEDGEIKEVREAERFYRQKRYKLQCENLKDVSIPSGFQYINSQELREYLSNLSKDWGLNFDAVAVQNQQRTDEYINLCQMLDSLGFKYESIINLNHHLCHAASAYFSSPFSSSLILSYDGAGNDGNTVLFKGVGNKLDYIKRLTTKFGNSYNNLGYIANLSPDVSGSTAGKAMGLTSYGTNVPKWELPLRSHILSYEKKRPKMIEGLNDHGKAHSINWDHIISIPEVAKKMLMDGHSDFNDKDETLHDFLNTAQNTWTSCVLELISENKGSFDNICVVGGCALNGITNYEIQNSGMFKGVHFIPNPSDCGLSMGAALYLYYCTSRDFEESPSFNGRKESLSPYLGEEVFDKDKLPSLKSKYNSKKLDNPSKDIAKLISEDKIVGVIRGRYEIGPRALGNRSILCNSQNKNMRSILNEKVKHREWYRPFAPVCVSESASKYFTNTSEIPYMSVICHTRDKYISKLPSVTHVDGSSRLQTVSKSQNSFLHDTLKEVEELTGFPIVLNTSFNPGGEPIVNYYEVALEMLDSTDLDYVLIEDELFYTLKNEDIDPIHIDSEGVH